MVAELVEEEENGQPRAQTSVRCWAVGRGPGDGAHVGEINRSAVMFCVGVV